MSDGGFGGGWTLNSSREPFPAAFADYASTVMPRGIREAIWWSEFLFTSHGVYSSACDRLVSYFLTPTRISGKDIGAAERKKFTHFADKEIKLRRQQKAVALDFLCYGNSYNTMLEPFDRFLICPGKGRYCGYERPSKYMEANPSYRCRWENCNFVAECPRCGYRGVWNVKDRKVRDSKRLVLKRWNPKFIYLRSNPVTGGERVIWQIPEEERQQIRQGYSHIVHDTPWEVVDCVRRNLNLEFDPDEIYHWREEPLAGLRTYGWGLPRSLVNFRQAWYVAVLHRFNEAIAMDYVIPTRVVSPAPGKTADPEAGDLLQNISMGDLQQQIAAIFRSTRRDPAGLHFSPIPLQYQMMGGEAKNLAPFELLDQGIAQLLCSIGMPVDFYKFSLQTQTAPLAARMLIAVWISLWDGLQDFTQWLFDRTSRLMNWEDAEAEMQSPMLLDILSDPSLPIALSSQNLVSPSSALAKLGFNYRQEQQQIVDDQQFLQELQARVQQEMDQTATVEQLTPTPIQQLMANAAQMAGGGGGGGSMPPAGGGGGGGAPGAGPSPASGAAGGAAAGMATATPANPQSTVQDVEARAQTIAQQLKAQPEGTRRSELLKLKNSDPLTHARVRMVMEQMDQEASLQGKQMVLQQQYGQP